MVDTDAKRIASFKRGLSPKMMKHVGTNTRATTAPGARFRPPQHKNQNYKGPQKSYKMVVPPAKTTATVGKATLREL
jgi:hypothetical protein